MRYGGGIPTYLGLSPNSRMNFAVPGVFASDQNIPGNRRGDFASALLQIEPNGTAPLLALSSGMESADAADTVITWFEENHLSGRAQVTAAGGVNSAAIQVTLVDASFIIPGTIMLAEATGEFVFVEAVVGNTITIDRGFAETVAQAIANSAFLQRIGTAFEEGSARPIGMAQLGYPRFNYMQIFRNAWDVTGTARRIEFYTGDVVAKNKADCGRFHAEDIEKSILYSRKSLGMRNGKPYRTMDGVLVQLVTNIQVEAGSVAWTDIQSFLQGIYTRNIKGKPNERMAFIGNTALGVINYIALKQSFMMIEPGVTEMGIKVMKWMTPFGDISLMTHPLMVESPLWTKELYVLHPGAMRTRWLRRTTPDTYDQDGRRAGVDADFGVLTSEMCVEYKAEVTGGKFTGIDTAGAKLT